MRSSRSSTAPARSATDVQVVLDPNVLVSALATPGGACAELLAELVVSPVEIVVSDDLLEELRIVLDRPRFAHLPSGDISAFHAYLRGVCLVDDDPAGAPADPSLSDPDDDYLIRLTLAAPRRVLVTGDRHLLEMAGTIPVVAPRELLDALRG